VPVNKPRGVQSFLDALQTVRTSKKKAANLLFEEIEQDVIDKEKFVMVQTDKIKEMHENYLTMLDYQQVLRSVATIIPSIGGGGRNVRASVGGGAHIDEEAKEDGGHFSINEAGR
jgi:hypothetical protein